MEDSRVQCASMPLRKQTAMRQGKKVVGRTTSAIRRSSPYLVILACRTLPTARVSALNKPIKLQTVRPTAFQMSGATLRRDTSSCGGDSSTVSEGKVQLAYLEIVQDP